MPNHTLEEEEALCMGQTKASLTTHARQRLSLQVVLIPKHTMLLIPQLQGVIVLLIKNKS